MPEALNPHPLASYLFGGSTQELAMGSVGQEKFCQIVAAGHTIERAYREAYGVPDNVQAAPAALRLSRAPHIVARIAQIRAASIAGFQVERGMLLENLLWALNTARERGATDQVRKIIMDIGKLFGLVIERSEAEVMHKFQVMKEVTLDGNALAFDIGDGKTINIKGERVEGQEAPYGLSSTQAIVNAQDSTESLASSDGVAPLAALQNAAKSLPSEPVALDIEALPVDARLDVGESAGVKKRRAGAKRGKVSVAGAKSEAQPAPLGAKRRLHLELSEEERKAMEEEQLAAYGEEFA